MRRLPREQGFRSIKRMYPLAAGLIPVEWGWEVGVDMQGVLRLVSTRGEWEMEVRRMMGRVRRWIITGLRLIRWRSFVAKGEGGRRDE